MQQTPDEPNPRNGEELSRRDFLRSAAAGGMATPPLFAAGASATEFSPGHVAPTQTAARKGLLYPQQNQIRNLMDLSGLWQFQIDPQDEGERNNWFNRLPSPRQIAVAQGRRIPATGRKSSVDSHGEATTFRRRAAGRFYAKAGADERDHERRTPSIFNLSLKERLFKGGVLAGHFCPTS